jgi:hypothetical protein
MENTGTPVDIVDSLPDPDEVRREIKECVERTQVLRQLLRVALKKARDRAGRGEVPRATGAD